MIQLLAAMPGAIAQGLIWGVMAIGVYITYKVLDIADLTVDGSICTGAAVCTVLLLDGRSIWLAMLCAVLAGIMAGTVTGLLHVLLGIPPILSGILTQMVLWSVNLKILGKANQALPARSLKVLLSQMDIAGALPVLLAVCMVLGALLVLFFGTELGCALRATGCNPVMSRAQGVNTQLMKVLGLALSNGVVALSGVLLCQYQGYTDVNMGRGAVDERVALDHLSLTLNDGDFVTVIGGNGAGKSTMQNAICGTWRPDEGSIELDGVNVSALPEYKRARYLGRVYQDPMMGTSAGMEIEENLALAERRGKRHTLRPGISRQEREDYRRRLQELGLGLEDRLTIKVGTLSGGQRQALTLLMATLRKPKLLLDEHTAALAPQTAQRVMDITDRLVRENHLTTLMITHNMRDAIHYGNRLIMLHKGRVVLDISGEEKAKLTVPQLLELFSRVSGEEYDNDRALLA